MKEQFRQLDHIPTSEVLQDIADTEGEIVAMEMDATFLESTPMGSSDAKINHLRASTKRSGIAERKQFVANLKALLEWRKSKLLVDSQKGDTK